MAGADPAQAVKPGGAPCAGGLASVQAELILSISSQPGTQ